MRQGRLAFVLPWLVIAAPLSAAALSVAKSSTVVSDGVSVTHPKGLPGSIVDFSLLVTNPLANALASVGAVTITDTIAPEFKLRVGDLGSAGSGPVEFADGDLFSVGALGTDLTYSFAGLASTTDSVEFSNGHSWAYVPVADADGHDRNVRAVRVTLTGSYRANTSFRLRYRAAVL